MQFNYYDNVKCNICGKSESFIKDNTNSNNNETNEIINHPISRNIYGQENNEENNNNYNLLNILTNNLDLESKNAINDFVQLFKREMVEIVSKKYNDFIQKEVENIYHVILEKYISIGQEVKFGDAMKSKEELTSIAEHEIKNQLKSSTEEKFLKLMSSNLFQAIIKIFEDEMIKKINEFYNKNKEIKLFLESNDIIPDDKGLKIEGQFNDFIKNLKQKEIESQEKALKYQEEDFIDDYSGNFVNNNSVSSHYLD
jgi:hypothetical protein